jgi:hypothetical protein
MGDSIGSTRKFRQQKCFGAVRMKATALNLMGNEREEASSSSSSSFCFFFIARMVEEEIMGTGIFGDE